MRDEALISPFLARVSLKFPSVKDEGGEGPQAFSFFRVKNR